MRSIDTDVLAQLEAGELRAFLLLEMTIEGTIYRYTDCDVPIVYGGNIYSPRGFKVNDIRYTLSKMIDSVEFEIDDLDGAMKPAFVGGTPQGSTVTLYLVVLNGDGAAIGTPVTLFDGELDPWRLDEGRIYITVAGEEARWMKMTLAKQSSSCRWKVFKGTECKYSGSETWCDRSYARCQALGNTANFGGQRWLPSIVDKEVWWGRKPK